MSDKRFALDHIILLAPGETWMLVVSSLLALTGRQLLRYPADRPPSRREGSTMANGRRGEFAPATSQSSPVTYLANRCVVLLSCKLASIVADGLEQYWDDLEAEAAAKGNIPQVMVNHFE
jgi:hypothetical protein